MLDVSATLGVPALPARGGRRRERHALPGLRGALRAGRERGQRGQRCAAAPLDQASLPCRALIGGPMKEN